MSYISYNPFNELPAQDNLNMLASVAGSIFAGRTASYVYDSVTQPSKIPQAYGHNPSQSFTKTKKMKYKRNTKKVATVAAVKRMIGQVVEKKQFPFGANQAFAIANINTSHSTNVTAKILQGTVDGTRVGDSIFLNSLHYNMCFAGGTSSSFYRFRILIGWSGEEYNPAGNLNVTGLTTSEIFIASAFDTSSQIINTKAFTPIYDQILDVNSNIAAVADGRTVRGVLRLNQKFNYQAGSSVYGKTKNLYICVIPSYTGNTPTTLGMVDYNVVLKYSDA